MTLHRGASVSGRAVTMDGKPIADARVLAVSTSEPFPLAEARRDGVVSGKNGEWSVASVAPGSYRFVLSHPDYEPATTAPVVVDGATPRSGIEIRATAGGEIRGVVTSASGVPVMAAEVRAIASGSVEWRTARQAFTDANGNYVIHGLPRRRAQVVATHATGASDLIDVDLTNAAKATANLRLSIDEAIDGTVVTASGEPVPEAQVVAEPAWSGNTGERRPLVAARTSIPHCRLEGDIHLGGLPTGSYRVRAARPGTSDRCCGPRSAKWFRPARPGLKLAISSPGSAGRVLYDDGNPPPAFTVAVGYGTPMPFATADGHFSIDVPGGQLNLAVSGPTFIRKLVAIDVDDGGTKDLGAITVKRGRSISGGCVLDASGVPVAAATVAAGLLPPATARSCTSTARASARNKRRPTITVDS